MPSKSKKQARFMAAVAHNPAFAKRVGVSQSVGREFNKHDKGTGILRRAEGGKVDKKKLDPPLKKTTMQRFADVIEGLGADNESRKTRRRIAAGFLSQWSGMDPKTGKPGSPIGLDLDFSGDDLNVGIRRPGIVDETMALPVLGEVLSGGKWTAPEWAKKAERRNYERDIAIKRHLGVDNPRGMGENFDYALGVMLGQIPLPGGSVKKGAQTVIEKGSDLVRSVSRLKKADILRLAKKYEPGILEYLFPTIEARPQNYLLGAGVGSLLGGLGDTATGMDFMKRHGGPNRATGGLMRSSDFGAIVEPRGVGPDLKRLKAKYAEGGKVAGTARAVKAIKDAIHHLDNKDVSSAASTLRASGNRGLMVVAERLRIPEIQNRLRKMGAAEGSRDADAFAEGGKVGGVKNMIEGLKRRGLDEEGAKDIADRVVKYKAVSKVGDVLRQIRALGLTAGRTVHGEFRVNFRGADDNTAYYTDDAEDAIGTARQMAKGLNKFAEGGKVTGVLSLVGRARQLIFKAEKELGELTQGQKVDLLLDNIPTLKNSAESRELVKKVETSGFAEGGKVSGLKNLFKVVESRTGQVKSVLDNEDKAWNLADRLQAPRGKGHHVITTDDKDKDVIAWKASLGSPANYPEK